jgi:uncharacterized RDD family membrane protein YckC
MAEPSASGRGEGDDPLAARILGSGARGARRLAGVAGVDHAVEASIEEAIVRAVESPALERALERLAEDGRLQDALERAAARADLEEIILRAIESEQADRIWTEVLASDKAQRLVERVAEAPEVRAAIAQQGFGLIADIGRQISRLTAALDDIAYRTAARLRGRRGEEPVAGRVGLLTRGAAFTVDAVLLTLALSIASGLLASIVPVAFGEVSGLSPLTLLGVGLAGFLVSGALIAVLWALVGQTPGMRFLGIRVRALDGGGIRFGRAVLRLLAIPISLLPAGLGVLRIVWSPTRLGLYDRIAGTEVVYDVATAPWSATPPPSPPAPAAGSPEPII